MLEKVLSIAGTVCSWLCEMRLSSKTQDLDRGKIRSTRRWLDLTKPPLRKAWAEGKIERGDGPDQKLLAMQDPADGYDEEWVPWWS